MMLFMLLPSREHLEAPNPTAASAMPIGRDHDHRYEVCEPSLPPRRLTAYESRQAIRSASRFSCHSDDGGRGGARAWLRLENEDIRRADSCGISHLCVPEAVLEGCARQFGAQPRHRSLHAPLLAAKGSHLDRRSAARIASRASKLTGFTRCLSKPASSERWISLWWACPLTAIM